MSENKVEVRCMINHVKMLLVDRGWFARFSRAISVIVGASATNDRCEETLCEFDSQSASCFVSLSFLHFNERSLRYSV